MGEAYQRFIGVPLQFIKSISIYQVLYYLPFITPKSCFLSTTMLEVGVALYFADSDPKAQSWSK